MFWSQMLSGFRMVRRVSWASIVYERVRKIVREKQKKLFVHTSTSIFLKLKQI